MKKLFKKKEKLDNEEGLKIGYRFAIKYSAIDTPLFEYDREYVYDVRKSVHQLHLGDISELYTVIEYIGAGQFLDLLTGRVFIMQVNANKVKDTITREYEGEALVEQEDLLNHPLAVAYSDYKTGYSTLYLLNPAIKERILKKSLPRKEEIKAILSCAEAEAQKLILDFYDKLDERRMSALYWEAREEDHARSVKARREESKRKEEAKRQAEEELKARVDPEFDEVFPKVKRK